MASLNKVMLIGNLGKDPEVRYGKDGSQIASFTIATSESWKDKTTGEKKERTEWHNLSAFGKVAEIVGQYLKKGMTVYVDGRITTEKWQDKEGKDRYTTKIIVNEMKMLGGGGKKDATASNGATAPEASTSAFNDDVPF